MQADDAGVREPRLQPLAHIAHERQGVRAGSADEKAPELRENWSLWLVAETCERGDDVVERHAGDNERIYRGKGAEHVRQVV